LADIAAASAVLGVGVEAHARVAAAHLVGAALGGASPIPGFVAGADILGATGRVAVAAVLPCVEALAALSVAVAVVEALEAAERTAPVDAAVLTVFDRGAGRVAVDALLEGIASKIGNGRTSGPERGHREAETEIDEKTHCYPPRKITAIKPRCSGLDQGGGWKVATSSRGTPWARSPRTSALDRGAPSALHRSGATDRLHDQIRGD